MPDVTTKTLNTRIQLKYDTYANWTDPEKQFGLLKGEIAVAVIPGTGYHKDAEGHLIANKPAVLIKVGEDGQKTYNQLDFIQAKAADVYNWAKAEKLNIETDDDVTAATKSWVQSVVSDIPEIGDTNTTYTIVPVAGATYKYELQYKEKGGANFASFTPDPVYIDLSDVATRLNAVEGILNGFGGQDEPATVAAAIADLQGQINDIDVSNQIDTALDALDSTTTAGAVIATGTPTVVTGVTQTNGAVAVTTQQINLGTAAYADVNTNAIADTDDTAGEEDNTLTTAAQVATYVKAKTAALTNAMHFRGALTPEENATDIETLATVTSPEAGDIYLIGTKEYVFDGTNWTLLGDEGTYAVRATVEAALAAKVDKVDGKGLSTEDYTTAEKTKLAGIEDGADVNVIEAVTVGGNTLTADSNKTIALGAMAGKDNVAEADLAEALATKVNNKLDTVSATIASVTDDVVTLKAGLTKNNTTIGNDANADITLAKIAKTGNVDDLTQTAGTYIVFDCGTASTVI